MKLLTKAISMFGSTEWDEEENWGYKTKQTKFNKAAEYDRLATSRPYLSSELANQECLESTFRKSSMMKKIKMYK